MPRPLFLAHPEEGKDIPVGIGREIVTPARQQHELRAGNDRGQKPSFLGAHSEIEHGCVVEQGTHDELLTSTPGYARLLRAYEEDALRRSA